MLKRSFDLVVAGGSLLLLTPVLLGLALLVKVSSPGAILYRAVRIGKGGQPFVMYKFRTMRAEGAPAPRVTPARDPRVTGVGRWLRENKLDELPQLWNVLKGEMSLVGSRPQDPRYFAHYTPEQQQVFRARPGLVSAANVEYIHEEELLAWAGANFEDYYIRTLLPEKLRVDLAYLERPGFFADLRLLLRAARRVVGRNWSATPPLPEEPRAAAGGGRQTAAWPLVSVVIPARNAARTLGATLDSIRAQDYAGPVEVVIADGSDDGATAAVARQHYPEARLVANPEKTTPHGLNAAIAAAGGAVVARCDCYTTLAPDYLRRAVATLERTGAAVVGGRQRPMGDNLVQRAVALALTTPLGAGDARYRLGGPAGPVDNFYLGVYTRAALEAVDGFDPVLTRNQDCEFNWRQRRRGELVWFDPELTVYYRPRRSLGALARQYFDYGRWKPVALGKHPKEVRARHLAAPLLVAGLLVSAGLGLAGFTALAAALPLLYAATLLLGALLTGLRRRDAAAILLPLVLATMHLSWGLGFFLPARLKGRTAADESGRLQGRLGE